MQPDYQRIKGHTRRLAAFSSALAYDDIPRHVLEKVKHLILDTLGAALAATTLGAGCREVAQVMRDIGGQPESTILGFGYKVAAPNAALANGALAHALNYDPIGIETGHVGVICLTAPLAMAEALPGISTRQFLTAVAIASEVTARISAAQSRTGKRSSDKFMAGQLFGYFGAAAGAGHLLGLDADQMHSAFGIALMQTSGSMQVVHGGNPPAKAVYGAFPNNGGLLAALFSKAGLGGECDALEGVAGLYDMFYGGEYREEALGENLGRDFLLTRTSFKPWPTSGIVHPFIEAASKIAERGVKPSAIKAVHLIGSDHILPWCEPIEERRLPKNTASAGNSVPFAVARALVHGDLLLRDFTSEGMNDEAANVIAARTTYAVEHSLKGGIVKVSTNDGQEHQIHIETPLGHPTRPVPYERLIAKFSDCCRYSITPLSGERVSQLIALIDNLENEDFRMLTGLSSTQWLSKSKGKRRDTDNQI
jgi:2-methylcitrate dehydratase PrpD